MAASVQDGTTVSIDYTLTVEGKVIDSSEGSGPLSYVQGQGQIITGLERELAGLHVGDAKDVTVRPEDGYGSFDPNAFVEVPKSQLPPGLALEEGVMLQGTSPSGEPFRARIHKISDTRVMLDLNHPLAGKTLQFAVKIVDLKPGH